MHNSMQLRSHTAAVGCATFRDIDERWRNRRHTVNAVQCIDVADHVNGITSALTWTRRAAWCLERDYPDGLPPKVREWAERNMYEFKGRWEKRGSDVLQ